MPENPGLRPSIAAPLSWSVVFLAFVVFSLLRDTPMGLFTECDGRPLSIHDQSGTWVVNTMQASTAGRYSHSAYPIPRLKINKLLHPRRKVLSRTLSWTHYLHNTVVRFLTLPPRRTAKQWPHSSCLCVSFFHTPPQRIVPYTSRAQFATWTTGTLPHSRTECFPISPPPTDTG